MGAAVGARGTRARRHGGRLVRVDGTDLDWSLVCLLSAHSPHSTTHTPHRTAPHRTDPPIMLAVYPSFDSFKYEADGLMLHSCGCSARSKHFLPRAHIDHISVGRQLYIGTLFVGTALMLCAGLFLRDRRVDWLLYGGLGLGGALILGAIILMIPHTLMIATNNGAFVSTSCCDGDEIDELSRWLSTSGVAAIAMPMYAVPQPLTPSAPIDRSGAWSPSGGAMIELPRRK
jgi:hypothetical protein